jgi:hypothetical protein
MEVVINFERKEIHFPEVIGVGELAEYLNTYFPEDIWGDFKTVIDD